MNATACHCGTAADGHLAGFCVGCSTVRCDAFPGACRSRDRDDEADGHDASGDASGDASDAAGDEAMAVQAWRTVEVKATAFPRDPFTDEQWEQAAEGLHLAYGDDGPGFGSSCGVWDFLFHDAVPADVRAGQIAGFLVGLGIEAEVAGRVVWTSMRLPVRGLDTGDGTAVPDGPDPQAVNVTVAREDGLWIAEDLDRQGCWASDASRDGALTALGRAQAAYDETFSA